MINSLNVDFCCNIINFVCQLFSNRERQLANDLASVVDAAEDFFILEYDQRKKLLVDDYCETNNENKIFDIF